MLWGLPAGAAARRVFAAVALLFAAFSSLATSADHCPQAISLSDTATVDRCGLPAGQHYTVTSARVHVLVTATSADASEVRIRLEPDFATSPGERRAERHGRPGGAPGRASSADSDWPGCSSDCSSEIGFSVIVEHLAGAAAALTWEVFAETDNCNEEFTAPISGADRPLPIVGERLLHPLMLLAIGMLLLNDHVLKDRWPGLLTGSLPISRVSCSFRSSWR